VSDDPSTRWERPADSLADEAAPPDVPIGKPVLDEPSAGLSPALQDEVFVRCRRINQEGVAILMVEQNARRCLQVCDRGYVLDQGTNAYTGSGRALLADPNVIELYLGTLVKATGG
jgi:branched-chain amino acid transport system ATP-binding protein